MSTIPLCCFEIKELINADRKVGVDVDYTFITEQLLIWLLAQVAAVDHLVLEMYTVCDIMRIICTTGFFLTLDSTSIFVSLIPATEFPGREQDTNLF